MSFIEVSPDLRNTNKLLSRIACALEQIVLNQYGVRIGHTTEKADDPNPDEKVTIGYASDEQSARKVLEDLAAKVGDGHDEPEIYNDRPYVEF